jgi:hypothetical protein
LKKNLINFLEFQNATTYNIFDIFKNTAQKQSTQFIISRSRVHFLLLLLKMGERTCINILLMGTAPLATS